MKRLALMPGVLCTILGIAACGCSSPPQFTAQELQYLHDVRHGATWPSSGQSDATLVGDGHSICRALSTGVGFSDVETVLAKTHLTAKQAAAMVASSVSDMCPQFVQQAETWIQQQK